MNLIKNIFLSPLRGNAFRHIYPKGTSSLRSGRCASIACGQDVRLQAQNRMF
ncbi:hypothetical protein ACFL20_05810 [Spirochaetota bacterium]